eukprot:CAMPEP_0115180774 /NCGR_PEP_ID=MMETSP0270-20121206/7094_1 /TAXON_ID=71861 /ORGANISM="Scrippsiella trochoidea, Strain CCMP3099" /LENGTH=84 /DNA_ID=CAMNT_0002593787 /DNA_START=9 /DNA_END=258 /DNA_ORIENTATION=+
MQAFVEALARSLCLAPQHMQDGMRTGKTPHPAPSFLAATAAERKHFNDSPEECELNKFDVMMAFLHGAVPGFRQLIAIDRSFQV